MSDTFRGRRVNFDNIAVGSETPRERHIAGGGGEATVTPYGGIKENSYQPGGTSFTSAKLIEHHIAGTTDQTNA